MAALQDPSKQRLIKTKLSAPQRRISLVNRPRLLALLSQGISRSLTLISAPAGYGKTTLLLDWLACLHQKEESSPPSICWLSLDEDDNDPTLFLNYFIATWENENSHTGGESSSLLLTFPTPPLRTVLAALINDLCSRTEPVWFVLDDYQCITSQAIHEGMAFFLDHLPAHVHLIIATRSDPPLPLARLRARDQLVEIRANDLRFTLNEAADFLNQTMQLPLSTEDIFTLEARTEGWIAGLQMAAVAMHGLTRQVAKDPQEIADQERPDLTQFVQGFSGSHRYILDYLAEEALNRQPADVQHFLAWTSLLDRFCASLCDALLADTQISSPAIQSQDMLAYLDKANLFLVGLDTQATSAGDQHWYRYHHLFTDLLRARLKQSQPEMIPSLHLSASRWYEQNGLVVEAIRHSLSAKAVERAADLIEHYGPARWSQSDTNIIMHTLHLPREILITHPKLGIYRSWIFIANGQMPAAILLLNDLKAALDQQGHQPHLNWMRACADLFLAYASHPLDQNQETLLPDLQPFDAMPVEDTGLHNMIDFLSAILLGRQGEMDRPAQILSRCLQRDASVNGTTAAPLAIPLMARTLLMQGRLHEAARICREYLIPVNQKSAKLFYDSGSLNIVLGEVLREWNDLEEAEAQIREGIQVNHSWQMAASVFLGYAALARVQESSGNIDGARNTLQTLEAMFEDRTKPTDLESELHALKIRLWLATGELAHAVAWVNQFPIQQPIHPLQETDYLTAARVRLAEKNYPALQHILEVLGQTPGIQKKINRKLKIDLLLACALAGLKQVDQALRLLETCLALAEPEGHIRVFLDIGEPMKELLLLYLSSPGPSHQAYALRLLDAFPGEWQNPAPANPQPALIEPLTSRELEILGQMGAGFSNQEIAKHLVLSEGTIKFHVHHILEKLEVHSRTAALVKAKELKLI